MARLLEVAFNLPVRTCFTYSAPEGVEVSLGYRVTAPFGKRSLTGCVVGEPARAPEGIPEIREIRRVVDSRPLFGEETLELARWLSRMYMCSLGEALAAVLPGGRREGAGEELPPEEESRDYSLTEEQTTAIASISACPEGSFYLFGVTGSGKTDVFLRVAEQVIAGGRGVIYLVPEISLTHQIVRVFRSRFGGRLAVLHSGLTPSQRLGEWMRVRDGEVDVAVGARSAVFAPFRKLGLIVIDEEHEGSYKSGATPRYHARQVAMHRASREKALLVMGSATPSVEAYHRMGEGKLTCFRLPDRVSGGKMPEVEIVDMKGQEGPFSSRLLEEISRAHAAGRQTILFLNRRGFSYFFHCRSCGYEMICQHCSVPLTFHRGRDRMICHYCGYASAPIHSCPSCGSMDVGYSGFGTEGIEQGLQELFPHMVISRIDTDVMRKRRALKAALSDFREGRVHVLVGTQMVAKGLNFPGVKLVGIVNADTGFQLPDFRAAERTFSLLVQVSGRAGRSLPDGKVLIQSFRPENPALVLAAQARMEEFYQREIETRRQLGFPPFSRLIRIVLRGRDQDKTRDAAAAMAGTLTEKLAGAAEVLGPVECPISRIAGSYRFHCLVRMRELRTAHPAVSRVLDAYRRPADVHLEVDVDPQALL
jgi:primosomal protein N' (replication factor Y) (superfamily II helicase)